MSLHLSGLVDILRLQTRDFRMGRNAPKTTFNKSRSSSNQGKNISTSQSDRQKDRQIDRQTHHWPVTSVHIKNAWKQFAIMSLNRSDKNLIVKLVTATA